MIPYYSIEDRPGKSGKIIWSRYLGFFSINKSTPQVVAFHSEPVFRNFNPFTNLQHKHLIFGWGGYNYTFGLLKEWFWK